MNNRRLYYPAVAYLLLLVGVWLLSWLLGVVALLSGAHSDVFSLVSAEGLRWALRSATESINSAPWAGILLFVTSAGLLAGSGVVKSVRGLLRGGSLAYVERRAWSMAALAFFLYLFLLFVCTFYPWNILLGVTGSFGTSTIVQGGAIILFLGLLFVTSIFGFIYGNYRSVVDIMRSVGSSYSLFAPALVAVLPASGIIPCAEYADILSILDVSLQEVAFFTHVMYLLPFVYIIFFLIKGGAEGK